MCRTGPATTQLHRWMGLFQNECGVLAVNGRLVEIFGINCWECGLFLATVGPSLKMASPNGDNQSVRYITVCGIPHILRGTV